LPAQYDHHPPLCLSHICLAGFDSETRLALAADPAHGRLIALGYEADGP
jgi:hypothetical protein